MNKNQLTKIINRKSDKIINKKNRSYYLFYSGVIINKYTTKGTTIVYFQGDVLTIVSKNKLYTVSCDKINHFNLIHSDDILLDIAMNCDTITFLPYVGKIYIFEKGIVLFGKENKEYVIESEIVSIYIKDGFFIIDKINKKSLTSMKEYVFSVNEFYEIKSIIDYNIDENFVFDFLCKGD